MLIMVVKFELTNHKHHKINCLNSFDNDNLLKGENSSGLSPFNKKKKSSRLSPCNKKIENNYGLSPFNKLDTNIVHIALQIDGEIIIMIQLNTSS
jgi:hypothetical protein